MSCAPPPHVCRNPSAQCDGTRRRWLGREEGPSWWDQCLSRRRHRNSLVFLPCVDTQRLPVNQESHRHWLRRHLDLGLPAFRLWDISAAYKAPSLWYFAIQFEWTKTGLFLRLFWEQSKLPSWLGLRFSQGSREHGHATHRSEPFPEKGLESFRNTLVGDHLLPEPWGIFLILPLPSWLLSTREHHLPRVLV